MTRAGDDGERSDEVGARPLAAARAPSPLRGWGYPHPLAGENGAYDPGRCN